HKHGHDVFVVLARFVARLAGREHISFGPLSPVEQCFGGLMILGRSGLSPQKQQSGLPSRISSRLSLRLPSRVFIGCPHGHSSLRAQRIARAVICAQSRVLRELGLYSRPYQVAVTSTAGAIVVTLPPRDPL